MSGQPKNPQRRKSYSVFVSGRYANRQRSKLFVDKLLEHESAVCPCHWFLHDRDDDQLTDAERLALSVTIRNHVRDCDLFVHLHEAGEQRGGNLVELGMALAYGKSVVAVCDAATKGVFHELPQVYRVETDDDAIAYLHVLLTRKGDPTPAARGVFVGPTADWQEPAKSLSDEDLAEYKRHIDAIAYGQSLGEPLEQFLARQAEADHAVPFRSPVGRLPGLPKPDKFPDGKPDLTDVTPEGTMTPVGRLPTWPVVPVDHRKLLGDLLATVFEGTDHDLKDVTKAAADAIVAVKDLKKPKKP